MADDDVAEQRGNRVVRWAILGTGSIANDMVRVLRRAPECSNCEVLAVGSRTIESAHRFADRHGGSSIARRYGSYEEACRDPDVDVVYVATPSARHPEDCATALGHGKAVLCEKCMAPDVDVARRTLDLAASRNLLFVHGVWSRFFPAARELRRVLFEERAIGDVRSARATFCQNDGAGSCDALLETGVYCVQFLAWALKGEGDDDDDDAPVKVVGATASGDPVASATALLDFGRGRVGTMECGLSYVSERSAVVYGTKGYVELPFPFWCPTKLRVVRADGPASQTWGLPDERQFPLPILKENDNDDTKFNFVHSEGLAYEAAEVARCVREGLTETPLFDSKQCLEVMRILTDVRDACRQRSND